MPAYGTLPLTGAGVGVAATAFGPGDSVALFSAEQPSANEASIAVSPYTPSGGYMPIAFDIQFAAAPTGNLLIQGASVDVDSAYQTLYTSTAKQQDFYGDQGSFRFYRAKLTTSSGGGNLTVTVNG